jgi:arginyl-tRNA synthetase
LADQLTARSGDNRLGIDPAAHPRKVVVDYSGPNIAKQMHVGHLRSTIIGDCLARVIEYQHNQIIRQNHLGDWGTQFGMLIAYLRSQSQDTDARQDITDLEEFYRQAKKRFDELPTFAEEARNTVVQLQAGQSAELAAWRRIVDETRRHYQPIYDRLGVSLKPEHERGESFYNPMLQQVVEDLLSQGIAIRSEGAIVVFTEGFENPLIIQKSDGGYLYGTTDLAAIRYRAQKLGATRIIYTHDSRQAQHFAQVFATAARAGWAAGVSLEYAPFGTMLGADGKPFKTRSGDTVKLKDLLDEAEERAFGLVSQKNPELDEAHRRQIARAVGIGAVKYSDLSKDRTSDYVFNWDKMLSLDGNTAPYLQYVYARIKSIFRKAGKLPSPSAGRLQLDTPQEQALAKHLLRVGEIVESVARELKPHLLCAYLYDLAVRFSSFYENCPVLQSEPEIRQSRLALCDLTARTMALGLDLLGIEHPEQM